MFGVGNAFSPLDLANSRALSGMQPNRILLSRIHGAKLIVSRIRFPRRQARHPDHQAFFLSRNIYLPSPLSV